MTPDDVLPMRVKATRYEVTKYPEGGVNAAHFTLWVERRDIDRWCVTNGSCCYDADGVKEYESMPSERTDDYRSRFRFSLDEAMDLAKRIVPTMRIGPKADGQTAEQVWAWEQDPDRHKNKA